MINQRFLLLLTTLGCVLLGSSLCHAETHRESQWLHYLQQGQTEGMDMPHAFSGTNEVVSLSQEDLKRLLGSRQASIGKRSKLQFTKLNYQADIGDKSLQLRLFYQF